MSLRPPRIAAALLIGLMAPALAPRPALAWGRLGHRASARLAESRLTPAARDAIRDLLEPGESLADAALWPDEHRRERPDTAPWHYVNVSIDEPRYDARFCPKGGCVVSKITDFRCILANPNASKEERREALRFLVHLVQDVHQPVHVGDRDDRGGNDLQLRFFGEGTNLHRLWDSGLIERHNPDEDAWVALLKAEATTEQAACWEKQVDVVDWATESLEAARRAYDLPGGGRRLRAGDRLEQDYFEAGLPVARERLARSGVRLAALLNGTLR